MSGALFGMKLSLMWATHVLGFHLHLHLFASYLLRRRRGMPGKAVQRLAGAPLAAPSEATIAAMRAKFPARPPHQLGSSRLPAPPVAIRSFPRGAAPGPSGLRPDFLKQVVGDGDEQYSAQLFTSFVNVLADGRAPLALRPYLGGARGMALQKVSKSGGADVRPLCAGEALRRLVGKALLRTELPALRPTSSVGRRCFSWGGSDASPAPPMAGPSPP